MKKSLMLLFGFGMGLSMAHSAPFSSEVARHVFDEFSPTFDRNDYVETNGFVFARLRWKIESSDSAVESRKKSLAAVRQFLERYVAPVTIACTNSPFCSALTSWMLPRVSFSLQNVSTSILKDETSDNIRTQIVAFDFVPLDRARGLAKGQVEALQKRSEQQWGEELEKTFKKFKTPEEKRKFFVLLGCPIVNLIADKGSGDYGFALPGGESGWAEFERIINWRPGAGSFYAEYPNLLWTAYAKRTDAIFFPSWSENDGGRLDEAAKLYRQGKDIPTIIRLLAESISMNPISSTKWEYLGGVLKASNKPCDAVIAYIQALKINSKSPWAWKGLVDSLDKAGFKANAAGLGWYLKIKGN